LGIEAQFRQALTSKAPPDALHRTGIACALDRALDRPLLHEHSAHRIAQQRALFLADCRALTRHQLLPTLSPQMMSASSAVTPFPSRWPINGLISISVISGAVIIKRPMSETTRATAAKSTRPAP